MRHFDFRRESELLVSDVGKSINKKFMNFMNLIFVVLEFLLMYKAKSLILEQTRTPLENSRKNC